MGLEHPVGFHSSCVTGDLAGGFTTRKQNAKSSYLNGITAGRGNPFRGSLGQALSLSAGDGRRAGAV